MKGYNKKGSNKKVPSKKVPEVRLSRYIFEQVLEAHFDGNRSECARELQMTYHVFKRHLQRFSQGHSSCTALESVLVLCGQKQIGLNAMVESYLAQYPCANMETGITFCEDTLGKLLAEMENHLIQDESCLNVKKAAERLLKCLKSIFCSRNCKNRCQDDPDCVCIDFTKFLFKLRGCMQEVERSLCAEIDAGAAVDSQGKAGEDSVEGEV
jgi:hypothetical protein